MRPCHKIQSPYSNNCRGLFSGLNLINIILIIFHISQCSLFVEKSTLMHSSLKNIRETRRKNKIKPLTAPEPISPQNACSFFFISISNSPFNPLIL